MTVVELFALKPFLILSGAIIVIMLGITVARSHRFTAWVAGVALVLAIAALLVLGQGTAVAVTTLLVFDGYALFFMSLILFAALFVVALSYPYLDQRGGNREEYYLLLLTATLGATVIVASDHFASFFLGLELLGLSLYAMIAYQRGSLSGLEAAIKYLILASVADGFLLMGMALIYADCGTMQFSALAHAVAAKLDATMMMGTAFLVVGIGFKLSIVPFHMWAPDVYEGAPAPVTAFLATVSKGAVFALLLRYFTLVDLGASVWLPQFFAIVSVASMIVGNVLALLQNNVKRILAYSSIAHMGYLLVAFVAGKHTAPLAIGYYLLAYFVTTLGAFGVIILCSCGGREANRIEDYRGLAWSNPWMAGVFTAMLLSLAGIPLTAGFVGKAFVMAAGIGSALLVMVSVLIVTSVVSLFYYLRIVVVMFDARGEEKTGPGISLRLPVLGDLVLGVLMILLIGLGIYPAPVIRILEITVLRLT